MDSLSTNIVLCGTVVIALSAISAGVIVLTGEDTLPHPVEYALKFQSIAAEVEPVGLREVEAFVPLPWSDEWYDTQKALRDNAATIEDVQAY